LEIFIMTALLELPPGRETGDSAPPRRRKRRGGSWDKPQKYIFVCWEDDESIAEIESLLEQARADIRQRVQVLTYTDPEVFEPDLQRALMKNVRSVVAICIRLTPDTVDDYFRIMCSLLTQLLPKFDPEEHPIDIRIVLCSLYTFWVDNQVFELSAANHVAWDDFLTLRAGHDESSWDTLERFKKPLFDDLNSPWTVSTLRCLLWLRIGY
jgi:hypothetical protein